MDFTTRRLERQAMQRSHDASAMQGELNIVPFLDVVVNLMLFLLATTSAVVSVAQIDASLPGHCRGAHCARGPTSEPSVVLADRAIFVTPPSGAPIEIARGARGYDFAALADALASIRRESPTEDSFTLTADPAVAYQDVVAAIDAARPTHPVVHVSAGVR
jgi:biopolymer transport protein TolR